jgi:hypothetical protein
MHHEDGTVRDWKANVHETWVPLATDDGPGFYSVRGDSFREIIAVNFDQASESESAPQEKTDLSAFHEPPWWWNVPLLAVASVAALLLSLLEWALAGRSG